MDEKIRETIKQLNVMLTDMNAPHRVDFVDPAEIKLLDKNARYMTQEMFQNLVDNIKRDGGLTSLPLCIREGDRYKVLSGNHRVKAAVAAGLENIMILYINKPVSRQQEVAIQLSHNAIAGKDDPVILKELWEEIEDIDFKVYAGLDSEILKELDKMDFVTIVDAPPETKQVIFIFLPEEIEQLKQLINDIDMIFSGDENYLLSMNHYQDVFNLISDIKDKYNIVNNPTAFMKIIELARLQIEAMEPESPGRK